MQKRHRRDFRIGVYVNLVGLIIPKTSDRFMERIPGLRDNLLRVADKQINVLPGIPLRAHRPVHRFRLGCHIVDAQPPVRIDKPQTLFLR